MPDRVNMTIIGLAPGDHEPFFALGLDSAKWIA
jgi:hypothetical protein